MENSTAMATDDNSWVDNFIDTTSIDNQTAQPNFEPWDPMNFSDLETLNRVSDSLNSIDNLIATHQNVQDTASSNQEFSYLDEALSLNHLASQSRTFPIEYMNGDSNGIKDRLQELNRYYSVF